MSDVKQMEKNVVGSFGLAKNDIMRLRNDMLTLGQTQQKIVAVMDQIQKNNAAIVKRLNDAEIKLVELSAKPKPVIVRKAPVVRKVVRAKKSFVAAKGGNKFHIKECPFAQNIKPKNKVVFKQKKTALNKGFKPCDCVK
ncbi:MAG: hypothetical protein ABIG95_04985 [Candidatus Woesearchaeota archaeon]